jgi:hypothetical protein
VGWLRPRVLLPLEWREWDRNKLDAVLAHEGAHVRRRDGLIAALAAVNRCVFWFHPLAWMLERKLALLASRLAMNTASQRWAIASGMRICCWKWRWWWMDRKDVYGAML